MKVRDILIPEQSLISLVESLSWIPNDLNWSGDKGYFSVNEERFVATVRPATSNEESTFSYFFDPIPKVGNVDFSMIVGTNSATQDTTRLMKSSAFKVFGGVAHIVSELKKKHGYEILLCIAKRKHSPTNFESRVGAYEVIVDRAARNAGMDHVELLRTSTEVVFVIFNYNLHAGIQAVQKHLNNYPR
ncbi:MAG: hypothetical protein CTY12_07845 [Methylotenera sp.]|nr:MAG: hypothetical protein CTY12_07845 [Methylotenera sp.]